MALLDAAPPHQDRAVVWQPPGVPGLDVLRAAYHRHVYPRHTHEHFVIGVVESGVEAFAYRRDVLHAGVGDVTLVNPDEGHTGTSATPHGYRYRALYPDAELLRSLTEGAKGVPFFERPVVHDPALYAALLDLHDVLSAPHFALERDAHLLSVLGTLSARYANAAPRPRDDRGLAQRIRARLQEDVPGDVSLAELARAFDVTPHHLVRSFTRAFGLPPHAYVVGRRVELARRLLRNGVSVAEVALAAGFYDQSHLGRHFKRVVGVTPAQYAASTSS